MRSLASCFSRLPGRSPQGRLATNRRRAGRTNRPVRESLRLEALEDRTPMSVVGWAMPDNTTAGAAGGNQTALVSGAAAGLAVQSLSTDSVDNRAQSVAVPGGVEASTSAPAAAFADAAFASGGAGLLEPAQRSAAGAAVGAAAGSLAGAQAAASAIDQKYAALGGAAGLLGQATSAEQSCPDGVGRFRHYQRGSIYWHPALGAFEVHGKIREKWSKLGWERSILGYPLTDERKAPDGVGRYTYFQNGSIYWHPKTGAFEVHGAIREKWAKLGWERSLLGYPTSDETKTADGLGRFTSFQNGSIYWHPKTGAFEVHGKIRDKWAKLGWERSVLG